MALTDNLVGVWCEASAPETDESTNAENLTNNSVGTTAGKVGTAGTFVGASAQYLFHADDALLSSGDIDWTVAAWVYLASKPSYPGIAAKADSGDTPEYQLLYRGGATDQFEWTFKSGTTVRATTFGSPSLSTYYWVCAWHDSVGNTINICVNNGSVDSAADAGGSDTTSGFAIGRLGDYGGDTQAQWDGRLNQVAMWKRVLTSGERTQLYNSGSGLAFGSWASGGFDPSAGFPWPQTNQHLVRYERGVVAYRAWPTQADDVFRGLFGTNRKRRPHRG